MSPTGTQAEAEIIRISPHKPRPAAPTLSIEKMVDARTAGEYMGFSAGMIRKLAAAGQIPGYAYGMGKQTHWRFKISELAAQAPTTVPSGSHSTDQG